MKTFEQNENVYIFLVLPKYHIFFSFSTALQKLHEIVTFFPEDKFSYINLDLQMSKVFTPQLLMHGFSFWSISEHINLL